MIRKVSTAALSKADLKKQVGVLTRELKEAREQQTATAEVLQVIKSSPGHVEPVFAAMLEKASQLCEAAFGILWLRDGEQFQAAALHGAPAAYAEIARKPVRPLPTNPLGRMLRGECLTQHDILRHMKVEEIAEAIAKLPPDQLARFRRWFTAFEAGRTDHVQELDSAATKLGRLAGRAFADLKRRAKEP
jgi:predicted component of type VI protein secretion system